MRTALLLCLLLAACSGESAAPIGTARAQSLYGQRISYELVQIKDQAGIGRAQAATECNWPGAAASGNLSVWFHGQHRRIVYARWVVTMLPAGGSARLVMYDDFDYKMTVLAEATSDYPGPTVLGGWIADQLNSAILSADPARPYKFLAVQVCGAARIYTSSIYLSVE